MPTAQTRAHEPPPKQEEKTDERHGQEAPGGEGAVGWTWQAFWRRKDRSLKGGTRLSECQACPGPTPTYVPALDNPAHNGSQLPRHPLALRVFWLEFLKLAFTYEPHEPP